MVGLLSTPSANYPDLLLRQSQPLEIGLVCNQTQLKSFIWRFKRLFWHLLHMKYPDELSEQFCNCLLNSQLKFSTFCYITGTQMGFHSQYYFCQSEKTNVSQFEN